MTRARSLSRLANSSAFTVDTNLNVGIGSTTPDVKLDVIGNMEVSGVLTATNVSVSSSVTAATTESGLHVRTKMKGSTEGSSTVVTKREMSRSSDRKL